MHRIILASLLLCGAAEARPEGAGSCGTNSCSWKTLEGQRHRFGLSEERVGSMLGQCRKSGLSAEEADVLLAPVRAARDESLPAEAVFTKIEEGLAKKVPLDRVTTAADSRLDYLRRASRLVELLQGYGEARGAAGGSGGRGGGHGPGEAHGGDQRLVVRTAMALESGLPEEVLREVFGRHGGRRYGRLIHVMEAGETLQLAGLDPQDTKRIMLDCIDRDLNRMEIQRAVDCIVEQHRKGRGFESIYTELWVSSGECS